ncbi:MAG: hypothetical protein O2923_05880 [Verrucomicrobia bacterium]|nr:hypothetical protein [Verrucomicrobiota bacterium]
MSVGSQSARVSPCIEILCISLILAGYLTQCVITAASHTPTVDEFSDVPMGLYHLKTHQFNIDRRNPPLMKILCALPLHLMGVEIDTDPKWVGDGEGWYPWLLGTRFMRMSGERYTEYFFYARMVVVAVSILLGLLVHRWAREEEGPLVALIALLLFTQAPAILGHSTLATLDIGVSALVFGGFYALRRVVRDRDGLAGMFCGLMFGLALGAKFVTLFFLPLVPLLYLVRPGSTRAPDWKSEMRIVLIMGTAFYLAVCAAYLFLHFPRPSALIEGIALGISDSRTGEFPAFLFGEWSNAGFPHYYLAALLVKMPVPLLVLLGVGLARIVIAHTDLRRKLFLTLPPLVLIYLLSFHYRKNYGIRYLLPAYPFLILIAASGAGWLLRRGRPARILAAVLVSWLVIGSIAVTPHHLSGFNILARNRIPLLDSNLDWGQDLGRLADYVHDRKAGKIKLAYFGHVDPLLYGLDYELISVPNEPGLYAISANFLYGYPYAITYAENRLINVPQDAFAWLRTYQPLARVGRSIYIFEVAE